MIGIANERKREKGRNEWEVSGQIFRKIEIEESVVLCVFVYQLTKRLLPHGFMSLHKNTLDVTLMYWMQTIELYYQQLCIKNYQWFRCLFFLMHNDIDVNIYVCNLIK